MASWIARILGALVLYGMLGCADHHGGGSAPAGRGESAAGSKSPEAGREPVAEAGSGGTSPPEAGAGGGPACAPPIGECFTALPLAPSVGRLFEGDIDGDRALDVVAPGGSIALLRRRG